MKFNKHPLITVLNKLVEQISRYLDKAHQSFVQDTVVIEARNYASKGLPKDSDSSMEAYFTTFRGFYSGLKKGVSVRLQGGIQKALGTVNLGTVNQKIDSVRLAIQQTSEKICHLEIDLRRIHIDVDRASYQKHRWLLFLFGFGECLWNMAFFLRIGDIVIIAACIGLIVGIAQIAAVKTAVLVIKEIENRRKQILYSVITLIAFILFSFLLGAIRYWFAHQGGGAHIPFLIMNPLTFVAINMLFIIATALVVYRYFPSKDDMKQIRKIEGIETEIEKTKQALGMAESQLNELLNERELLIELRGMILHNEKTLLEKVDSYYEQAIGIFKEENTSKRSDGKFPQSFNNPHNPLPRPDLDDLLLMSYRP